MGRGQSLLGNAGGLTEAILGGWQISGTVRAYTGQAFTVLTNDPDLNAGESPRPNRIGKGLQEPVASTGKKGVDYPWFAVTDFEAVPCFDEEEGSAGCLTESLYGFEPYVLGNSGRNILDGPGLLAVDAALVKNFRFKERRRLQVRLEAFNVLNHTNLLLPNNRFNSITGGFINRTGDPGRRGGPRTLQVGLRFQF